MVVHCNCGHRSLKATMGDREELNCPKKTSREFERRQERGHSGTPLIRTPREQAKLSVLTGCLY